MQRITTKKFEQDFFIAQYRNWFGKDTLLAIKEHKGLCQAFCTVIALKGHEDALIETLFDGGSITDPSETVSDEKDLSELKKLSLLETKASHLKQLFLLIDEVAIRAHPIDVISFPEKLYRLAFDKFSIGKKVYDNHQQYLLNIQEGRYVIDRKALFSMLEKYDNNHYIELSFVNKSSGSSLEGHATLLFKSKNRLHFFDPNRGLFVREDISDICDEIDTSIEQLYNLIKKPLYISIIDLKVYLELYKSVDFIKKISPTVLPEFLFDEEKKQSIAPLHLAIDKNATLLAKVLLDAKKADVNAMIDDSTPLELAIKKNDLQMIKLFLQQGAVVKEMLLNSISDPEIKSLIILQLVVRYVYAFPKCDLAATDQRYIAEQSIESKPSWTKILKEVMDKSSKNKNPAMNYSFWMFLKKKENTPVENKEMSSLNEEYKKYFVSEKALQNTLIQLEEKRIKLLALKIIDNNETLNPNALFLAINSEQSELVHEVILRGAFYFLAYWEEGGDMLQNVIEKNFTEIAKILIENAKKIELEIDRVINGDSYLCFAIENRSPQIVQYLCKAGLDVNYKNFYNGSLLDSAISKRSCEIAKILLDAKADIHLTSKNQEQTKDITPLEAAIETKDIKMIKLLLDYGAEIQDLDTISDPDIKSFITLQLLIRYIKNYEWQPSCPELATKQIKYIAKQPLEEKTDWQTVLKKVMDMSITKTSHPLPQLNHFAIKENKEQLTDYLANFSSSDVLAKALCKAQVKFKKNV